jgi:hypothetical protein
MYQIFQSKQNNTSNNIGSTIGGGLQNTSSNCNSTISGGFCNTSSGNYLRLVAGTSDTTIGTLQNIALSFVMNGTRYGRFTSTNGNLILDALVHGNDLASDT